ncbi:hypothetical protein MNB_SM-3-1435 [hydrothermal vent metagenome]|uniref:FxsA protein n=1 Tax=hydrothermal vent metagenome TaxID=652676 RepID=A0A1W1D2I3_9ZZZZ
MVYFLIYLFLEVIISVNISSHIGGLLTFFEILLSAFIGIAILMNFKKTLFENLRAVSYSCIDLEQFQRLNLFTLFGAIMLILPGFLTDIIGLLLQSTTLTTMLVNRYHIQSARGCDMKKYNTKEEDEIIDVEIIDTNTPHK